MSLPSAEKESGVRFDTSTDVAPTQQPPPYNPQVVPSEKQNMNLRRVRFTDEQPPISSLWSKSNIINAFCVLLNASATIITVFLNKIVFRDPQLRHCQTSVVIYHFAVTFFVLYFSTLRPFQLFEVIRVPLAHIVPISLFFAGFLVLNNLSLTFNSVGFYQLTKILTTPCLVLLNFLLFGKTTTQTKLAAVLCTCLGVGLTSSETVQSNPVGAAIATSAFVVTALYQIWIGKKLQDLAIQPAQLLMNQAVCSIILLAFLVPIFDSVPDFSAVPTRSLQALLLSGLTASMINLSQFLIIGRTSALTFNIVGMLKTVSIVSLGWFSDGTVPASKDLVGVFIALGGAWLYAQESSK